MATLPYEIYKLLEEEVGKEKAEIKEELTKELSTKADIAEVRSEIAEVRSEFKAEIAQVRAEFKEEIKSLEIRLTREIEGIKSDVRVIKVLIYVLFLLIVLLNGDKLMWVLDFIRLFK